MLVQRSYQRHNLRPTNGEPKTSPTRVVIADNQTVARLGTHQLLEQAPGIQVVGEVRSGREALHLVETIQVDVVVAEMRLPDLSGADIAREIDSIGASSTVLILSAYEEESYIRQVISSPVAGYLLKSDTAAHVTEAVMGAARNETGWLSPSVARCLMGIRRKRSMLESCQLTAREREALEALMQGFSNEQIAEALNLSVGTVKNHLTNIYQKLGVSSRSEAIVWAQGVHFA